LLLGAAATAAAAHQHIDTSARIERGERFVPQPEQARLSSLGFNALLADAYWIQAVQIVGGERQGVGEHAPLIGRLIDVVTSLDPWVGHPYRFAAVWLTENLESVQQANALLERAIAYHPRDWRNRHYLGFNHFFYLGDDERAAEILETAVGLPHAPNYLAALVAKLRQQSDGLETAEQFLVQLAESTEDEYARAAYLKALDEVLTERRARLLDAAREVYRGRFGRDIARVEDLVSGPSPVLRRLPSAHPHFGGFEWRLDPETGEIVSSFYKGRYRARVHPLDRARRERWRRDIEARRQERL
jgi:tetratricopeptide (TPR) repeat protein